MSSEYVLSQSIIKKTLRGLFATVDPIINTTPTTTLTQACRRLHLTTAQRSPDEPAAGLSFALVLAVVLKCGATFS